jgi:hypothetical protein
MGSTMMSGPYLPTIVTLRMKLALVVGPVLGTWERMDFSLFGGCIDELAGIMLSSPIGECKVPLAHTFLAPFFSSSNPNGNKMNCMSLLLYGNRSTMPAECRSKQYSP